LAFRENETARERYEKQNPQVAARFTEAVDRAVQQIADDPNRWPEYRPHYRWVPTRRFPYLLNYRMRNPDHAVIVAVAHGRRRPGYWLRRTLP
jgi:plasmid stabilization system protein ParE